MKTKQSGSILIIVLTLISFAVIMTTVSLQKYSLFFELAHHRATYQQKQHALDALLEYGIAYLASKTKEEMPQTPYAKTFDHWPTPNESYHAQLTIEPEKDQWKIHALLSQAEGESMAKTILIAREMG